jgi:hypothetical protein
MIVVGSILGWLVFGGLAFLWYFRRELISSIREPVLRCPVLIIESDDWGTGDAEQATALDELASLLEHHRDERKHPAVITLGIVLGNADTELIVHSGLREYRRKTLDLPEFEVIRRAMRRGVEKGVFDLQLHGLEHYWPPTLMNRLGEDSSLRRWMTTKGTVKTEDLPRYLQSRWTDASTLPSNSLRADLVESAVQEEVRMFRQVFGRSPLVAVPPTFLWTSPVEEAWAKSGIEVIVTPGRRYEGLSATGRMVDGGVSIYNGMRSRTGVVYVVRRDYFEPQLGHTADQAIEALRENTRRGRPTLLETHRFNFVNGREATGGSYRELARLLQNSHEEKPSLRYLTTYELANCLAQRDPEWVETSFRRCFRPWVHRLSDVPRLYKASLLTGTFIWGWLLYLLGRRSFGGENAANERAA